MTNDKPWEDSPMWPFPKTLTKPPAPPPVQAPKPRATRRKPRPQGPTPGAQDAPF